MHPEYCRTTPTHTIILLLFVLSVKYGRWIFTICRGVCMCVHRQKKCYCISLEAKRSKIATACTAAFDHTISTIPTIL